MWLPQSATQCCTVIIVPVHCCIPLASIIVYFICWLGKGQRYYAAEGMCVHVGSAVLLTVMYYIACFIHLHHQPSFCCFAHTADCHSGTHQVPTLLPPSSHLPEGQLLPYGCHLHLPRFFDFISVLVSIQSCSVVVALIFTFLFLHTISALSLACS